MSDRLVARLALSQHNPAPCVAVRWGGKVHLRTAGMIHCCYNGSKAFFARVRVVDAAQVKDVAVCGKCLPQQG